MSPRPVCIGALAPDAGETPQDLIGKFDAPPLFSRLDNEEGRIWISRDGISDFVGDLPEAEQRVVWATQGAPREEVLASRRWTTRLGGPSRAGS